MMIMLMVSSLLAGRAEAMSAACTQLNADWSRGRTSPARDLGFFDPYSGFASDETITYRANTSGSSASERGTPSPGDAGAAYFGIYTDYTIIEETRARDGAEGSASGSFRPNTTDTYYVGAQGSLNSAGSVTATATCSVGASAPVATASNATVAANSTGNVVALALSGGTATSVAVVTPSAHGTTTASGTSITYTPTAGYSGGDGFTYTATNAGGTSAPATVTVTVRAPTLAIAPAAGALPSGIVGTAYNRTLAASSGTAPYGHAVTAGALPTGLTLASSGAITGTPTSVGSYTFAVTVTDGYGATGTANYTISIVEQAPVATASNATVAANSTGNAIAPALSGGTATSVTIATQAAHGTATASGTSISYAPAVGYSGSDAFTYTAANASGTSSPATVTITVTAPTLIVIPSSGTLPGGTVGTAYSRALAVSGGTAPYSHAVTAGSLPAGLTLAISGTITGTPTTAGSHTFAVTVTDANGATGTANYTLAVVDQTPVASASSANVAANSTGNTVALALSGGTPTSVTITAQATHGTATASGTTISYTPVAGYSGSDVFSYTATNASGTSAPAAVTLTVTAPTLAITPSGGSLPSGTVGMAYGATLSASGGTTPYGHAVTAGALPAGLTLAGSGAITGTPNAVGRYMFAVTVTDAYGATGAANYAITITEQTPVASASSVSVAANSTATPIPLALSGGTATVVAIVTQAGNGTATASGTSITYTPNAGYSGSDGFTYTATNAGGTSLPATVNVTITAPTLTIAPGTLPAGTVGTVYGQALATSGGTAPYAYAVSGGTLPSGLTLSAAGALSGTPTDAGRHTFTVTVTDASGASGSTDYTIVVAGQAPVAGTASAVVAANSTGNAMTLPLSGGAAVSVAVTGAPAHGTATASGTSITYTPSAGYAGSDGFAYTATNASGTSMPATVSITITAPTVTITPASLPAGAVGTVYSQTIATAGGTAPYTHVVASGAIPAGLTLSSAGVLSGTPSEGGTFTFAIMATDSSTGIGPFTGTRAYALTIAAPTMTITPASLPDGALGVAYRQSITAEGGTAPYAFAVTAGALPVGVTLTGDGTLSGTPRAGGTFAFTIKASDGSTGGRAYAASRSYTLLITVPTLAFTPAEGTLAPGTVGVTYGRTFSVAGGSAPYRFTATGMPIGLTLSGSGTFSGTPTTAGDYTVAITVTDANGATGSASYAITVAGPVPIAGAASVTVPANSSTNAVTLALTGGAATSVAVASAPAHGTATASGTGIAYTPAAGFSGADAFTYVATNASGTSMPATVSVIVTGPTLAITPATLPAGAVGTAYERTFATTGGASPYRYVATGLPAGLALTGSGTLSGIPSTPGSYTLTVDVTDANGVTGSTSYTLTVAEQAPIAGAVSATLAANGTATAIELVLSGGAATSVAVASPPAHGTAAASGTGIVYRPTAGFFGGDRFTYTATNASGTSAPATVNVTVTAPTLSFGPISGTLPDGTAGTAYGQTISASGGTAPYRYRATGLPTGLTIDPVTGVIAGTPTTLGDATVVVTAIDANGAMGSSTYALVVVAQVPIAGVANATVPANSTSNAVGLALSGGTATSVSIVSAPSHGTATASGIGVVYTPATGFSGTDGFSYTATNASGTSAPATVRITVSAPTLTMTPTAGGLPSAVVGVAYDRSIAAEGGAGSYRYVTTALPAGLTLAGNGAISGVPTEAGGYAFTVTVTDANGATGSANYTITVREQAPIAGAVGLRVAANSGTTTVPLDLTGGTATTVAIGSAPAHGTARTSGTSIVYTPNAGYSGADVFTYTATNAGGTSAPAEVSVIVTAPTLTFESTTASLSRGTVGAVYGQALPVSGGTAPYAYTATGLPDGLSLNATSGVIAGTPTVAGTSTVEIGVTDAHGATGKAVHTIVVGIPAPSAGDVVATVAANSTGNVLTLAVKGGSATSFAVVTAPTHGTATVSGTGVSYTPAKGYSGSDAFTYTATNVSGTSVPATVTITVTAPMLDLSPAAGGLPEATAGTAYSQSIAVGGGTAPYKHAVTGLPVGLAMGTSSGVISGMPETAGSYPIDVTVTDARGATGSARYVITVAALPAPKAVDATTATVPANTRTEAGQSVSLNLSALVSGRVDDIRIVTPPRHGTVTLSRGVAVRLGGSPIVMAALAAAAAEIPGQVVAIYVPEAGYHGTDSFQYVAVGPGGTSAAATATIEVVGRAPIAEARSASTTDGQTVSIDLTAGAGEGPFTDAAIVGVSPADQATARIIAGETATARTFRMEVTPKARFSGTITVGYTLTNRFGTSTPGLVSVAVTARPDPANDPIVRAISDAQSEATRRFSRAQVANFMRRTESLHGSGCGRSVNGLRIASSDRRRDERLPGDAHDPRARSADGRDGGAGRTGPRDQGEGRGIAEAGADRCGSPVAVWTGGAIDVGTRDAVTGRSKVSATTTGVSVGIDTRVAKDVTIGVGGGFGHDGSGIGGGGRVSGDTGVVALYGSAAPIEGMFIDGMIGRGWLDFDTRRSDAAGPSARGERDGRYVFGALSSGIDRISGALRWSLYGRAEYMRGRLDAYRETGTGILDLRYDDRKLRSLTGVLGFKTVHRRPVASGLLSTGLRGEWQHDFTGGTAQALDYADLGGSSVYRLPGQGWAREQFTLSPGIGLLLPSGWEFGLDLGVRAANGEKAATTAVQVRRKF